MARIAQKDIASMLGVSQTTVSAVLSENTSIKISDATRKQILDAAAKAQYWPNRLANSLRARKTMMIGIIHRGTILQIATRKLNSTVKAVEAAGYTPMLSQLVFDHSGEEVCRMLRDLNVDGLVLLGLDQSFFDKTFSTYLDGHFPMVAIDGQDEGRTVHFRSDRVQGFRLATEHLLAAGYRSFGILSKELPPDAPTYLHSHSILTGCVEVLRQAGIEPILSNYRANNKDDRFNPYNGGRVAMERLLEQGQPEAVICSDDSWAVGALETCWQKGIRVPDDMAMVGFQNEIQGQYSHPSLTTVDPPVEELAQKAVDHLLRQINGEPTPPETFYLPCQLIIRESCGTKMRHQENR